jgi:hypothetical protein
MHACIVHASRHSCTQLLKVDNGTHDCEELVAIRALELGHALGGALEVEESIVEVEDQELLPRARLVDCFDLYLFNLGTAAPNETRHTHRDCD